MATMADAAARTRFGRGSVREKAKIPATAAPVETPLDSTNKRGMRTVASEDVLQHPHASSTYEHAVVKLSHDGVLKHVLPGRRLHKEVSGDPVKGSRRGVITVSRNHDAAIRLKENFTDALLPHIQRPGPIFNDLPPPVMLPPNVQAPAHQGKFVVDKASIHASHKRARDGRDKDEAGNAVRVLSQRPQFRGVALQLERRQQVVQCQRERDDVEDKGRAEVRGEAVLTFEGGGVENA